MNGVLRCILCVVVFFILACAPGTKGEETGSGITEDETSTETEMTFEEYVAFLKRQKPTMPIDGSHFTSFEGQLPNAPRAYRHGFHEGFDFYDGFCGVKIKEGTPVVAVADGKLIRCDSGYIEIEPAKRAELLAETKGLGYTPETTQDVLRGRQVWIEHGKGIVTRYCHLSRVADDIPVDVKKGMVIGFVGGSGTESKTPHLHFEIRFGDNFFGEDMSPQDIRKLAQEIFSQQDSP
jgi:murein DD-endopeptidase MepM/ murein hydrolase activator NlpD